MKRMLSIPWFALAAMAAAQEPLAYETTRWLAAAADFGNGTPDGRNDLAVVDRLDGTLRLGFQRADGGLDWTAPQATGFSTPASLTVGHFNGVPAWQLALSATAANRASVFTPVDATSAAGVRHVFPFRPAPRAIAGVEIDGSGATDLAIIGAAGGGLFYTEFIHQLDGVAASLWSEEGASAIDRMWPFRRKTGTAPVLAAIQSGGFLTTVPLVSGPDSPVFLAGGPVTPETRMAYGFFNGSALARVLLYQPGGASAHSAGVTEPTPGNFAWTAVATLGFPKPLELIVAIQTAGGTRLGVLYTDGSAAVFDFDGITLTHRSDLPGIGHELLLPLDTDAMVSLKVGAWSRWNTASTDAVLTPVAQGMLPTAGPGARVSNIIFVSHEPFADPDAEPVFFGQTGDWTLAASGSGSSWSVTTLSQGPGGLAGPQVVSYQPQPGAPHALPNQYRADVSLHSLDPGAGPPVGEVFITPSAGHYPALATGELFPVDFAASAGNAVIRYRTHPDGAWQIYDPAAPPGIAAAATVEAFARFPSGTGSPTRSASYTFGSAPPLVAGPFQDADGNGLSDQWEGAFNLHDPAADADGDGVSNYGEFLAGSDPLDPGDFLPVPLHLTATLVGSGPTLALRLEWPLADAASRLETSTTLTGWTTVAGGITTTATHHRLDVSLAPPAPQRRFFRLARP
jgi:hypothetical protein